ncbi:MAG: MFS transporter, partial [Dehalococcoidia bacterium]|nr:MFS transporter [Dehalococcoidia bacterium]
MSAGITFILFIIRQGRADSPLLPLIMFRSPAFGAANGTHLLVGAALIIGMVTIPLMANTVLEKTALGGGLMLMRMTIAIPVGAVLGGLACQRMDARVPTVLGLLLIALGFGLMSSWGTGIAD